MTKTQLCGAGAMLLALAVGACSRQSPSRPQPPVVGVVMARAATVPVTREYPGRLAATLVAQVRARVTGIVLKRVYTEGTDVKAGNRLFKIDPAPLQATLRAAEGQLAQVEATAHNAKLSATRSETLGSQGLLAQQDVDNAVATAAADAAAVQSAKANVENARINLGYATVTAPITGRAGVANVTQGALVQPTDTNPLTTVQVINPIYADFSEPMAEVEKFRQAKKSENLTLDPPAKIPVKIVLPDGSVYPHDGTLDFTDLAVDPATGAVNMRALVPNPDETLLPGMFVTIRLTMATLRHAFLLPQSAIQHDNDGAFVFVVGAGDKVVKRPVSLGDQRGPDWVVSGGLANGERVLVSGIQVVHAGEQVTPTPYSPAPSATSAAPTAY